MIRKLACSRITGLTEAHPSSFHIYEALASYQNSTSKAAQHHAKKPSRLHLCPLLCTDLVLYPPFLSHWFRFDHNVFMTWDLTTLVKQPQLLPVYSLLVVLILANTRKRLCAKMRLRFC